MLEWVDSVFFKCLRYNSQQFKAWFWLGKVNCLNDVD